jgi:REP element-mobilizing transposase RayT
VAKASDFRGGRHVLFKLQAHLVFVPKYRRAALTERVFNTLREAWEQVCEDFECELRETDWESDHVRLTVSYPHEGVFVAVGQLAQRSERAPASHGSPAGSPQQSVGRAFLPRAIAQYLAAEPARDRQALCSETARRGFLPALKDGVSAPATN